MRIFVIGHKSPDLDTVASAVLYANLLKELNKYPESEIIPVRTGEANKEVQVIFQKFGFDIPKDISEYTIDLSDKFVLVDHNEISHRDENIIEESILEILDHHKANIEFAHPIDIIIRTVGSCSSVIYKEYQLNGVALPDNFKALILSSILSDTQGLKSSTTTEGDISTANEIAQEIHLDTANLIYEIFKAKSDVTGLSPMDLVKRDYKVFNFNGNIVFIDQIETVEPENILNMKADLITAMQEVKTQENAKFGIIIVTDILKTASYTVSSTEEEKVLIETVFKTNVESDVADIGKLTSRKKDIAPKIESYFS